MLLQWETASESDNAFYTIERGWDGIDFEPIAYLDGAGSSSSVNQYQYIDRSPGIAAYYYRLKQTDFNGNFTYSEVLRVEVGKAEFELKFYPNPVESGESLTVEIRGGQGLETYIEIRTLKGRLVKSQYREMKTDGPMLIDTRNILPGIYLLRIRANSEILMHRVIIN